jgi:hypothetical protein
METPISPKVIVSVIVGIILTALVSNLSALTPDMLDFLGPWKLFVFGTLITTIMGLAGWWKTDPLRVLPPADKTTPAPPAPSVTVTAPPTAADPAAPATTFPAARVEAALAEPPAVAPAEVAPILPN